MLSLRAADQIFKGMYRQRRRDLSQFTVLTSWKSDDLTSFQEVVRKTHEKGNLFTFVRPFSYS